MSGPSEDVKLIFNGSADHGSILTSLLAGTQRFQCLTAFARVSGLKLIRKALRSRLETGMQARFVIGLDFFQTEPPVLDELLKLSSRYPLELYVSRLDASGNGPWNFHPKVFTFESAARTSVIVGSANLTGGGLGENHEISVLVHEGGALVRRIDRQVNGLIRTQEIVLANSDILREYARQHAIHSVYTKLAKRQAAQAAAAREKDPLHTLEDILRVMKADHSPQGFTAQKKTRAGCRVGSVNVLRKLAAPDQLSEQEFTALYTRLADGLWHSGGLHRGKTAIAQNAPAFRQTLRDLNAITSMTTGEAFSVVHKGLQSVKGAGPNVMTEILHSFDSSRFAVMNQNSVYGLTLAGCREFPERPDRDSVDAFLYARFCNVSNEVRKLLGLKNFTELDALFNYAYWSER